MQSIEAAVRVNLSFGRHQAHRERCTFSLPTIFGVVTDPGVMSRKTCAMKTPVLSILVVAAHLSWAIFTASAHPGSGIVVDAQGSVYFTYIEHGVGKIDPQGKLTYVGHTRGGHWMCL